MTDTKGHINEISSLHTEIFTLTKENESLRLMLKMLAQASSAIISNDVGNIKWNEAEEVIKTTKHQVEKLINK